MSLKVSSYTFIIISGQWANPSLHAFYVFGSIPSVSILNISGKIDLFLLRIKM